MTARTATLENARICDLSLEVPIQAAPDAVWRALTDDIGRWWPGVFFCGSGPGSPRFVLEPRVGGRMYEDWGNGEGLQWATVVNVHRGKRLELHGVVGPAWGGPTAWYAAFEFIADGKGTRLKFSESGYGRITQDSLREKEKGWRFLWEGALRAYLEGKPAPVWEAGSC